MASSAVRIKDPDGFGRAVPSRRKALRYTQKYIPEITGISASFLSDLENGKTTVAPGRPFGTQSLCFREAEPLGKLRGTIEK